LTLRRTAFRYAEAGKKSIDAGPLDKEDRWPDGSFAERHGPEAQAFADELHRKNPAKTWGWIQGKVAEEFSVSARTVRDALRNPKKLGGTGGSA
jgi:hypothetical protein